ncbi:hypothetical protein B1B_14663 [mine drainage metagenome]|uniref:Cellulose biosynthesis protein BcsS n=1 Tax=mine drainage metagenome TaxID=410659 RepID=T0ZAN2_9ZZZZ
MIRNRLLIRSHRALALLLLACVPALTQAGPASKVYTPQVSYGEWELELRGGAQQWPGQSGDRAQQYVTDIGYGIAPRWFTELAVFYAKMPGNAARIEGYEWENVFQLTEIGEYWMDVGLFAEIAHDRIEKKNYIELGPMLQKEFGQRPGQPQPAVHARPRQRSRARHRIRVRWQWKWRGNALFEPGLQGFGSFGRVGYLHAAENKLGPAFFGRAALGAGRALKYDAALLFGTVNGSPDRTLRFQLEYEFF